MRRTIADFNYLVSAPPEDLLGRFILIVGDVNSGKTTLSAILLERFGDFSDRPVTVVDLAPAIERCGRQPTLGGRPIGGALQVPREGAILYRRPGLAAPRLEETDETRRAELARRNAERIEALFEQLLERHPLDILFINDASLYLQGGRTERLLSWIGCASTAVINGYFGHSLGPGALSRRERQAMKVLIGSCDLLVHLQRTPGDGTTVPACPEAT